MSLRTPMLSPPRRILLGGGGVGVCDDFTNSNRRRRTTRAAGITREEGIRLDNYLRPYCWVVGFSGMAMHWINCGEVERRNTVGGEDVDLQHSVGLFVLDWTDPTPPRNDRIEDPNASREQKTKLDFGLAKDKEEITGN